MEKVILITGAGAGMGRAIALHYAKLNAKLSIADIDAKGLEETVRNYQEENILRTVIDLTKDDDVKALVDNTVSKYGKIDVLVNCAGIIRTTSVLDSNLMEVYDKVMAINLRSIVLLTSLCAPILIQNKGCVVNIGSALGVITSENYLAYSASKAGLDHFTRCTALELAAQGVRVNTVLPGLVNSNLYINAGMTTEESKNFLKTIEHTLPLKRVIDTEEIVGLVAFLASEKACSMTGGSYLIDAGSKLIGFDSKDLVRY